MLDYGRGMGGGYPNDFAAMPKIVQGKPKYKDPYGPGQTEEYYPMNIMYDRRIARGSTYAAMVIPAGTNPDTMITDKQGEDKTRRTFKKKTFNKTPQRREIYPNRDIPTPDPVEGRMHMEIQTDKYQEQLTDKPPEKEQGVATEFYLDRPPMPLFQPKMPSKENCKYVQTLEEDDELFGFDNEVEPMLNVLIDKTLEQARMIVLEEEEQKMARVQAKEYEEIRNAELIEAQRLEAAELRRKQELERRRVQQKARKEDRKAAHQKHVARVMAKKYLGGLQQSALQALKDQGMMTMPIEQVVHENVYPWVMDRMADFLQEEDSIENLSSMVVNQAFDLSRSLHQSFIDKEYERRKKEREERERQIREKEEMRADRRQKREKRRKEQELLQLKQEIKQFFIDKAELKDHISQQELMDINGHFERNRHFLGAVGGQLMQIHHVFSAISSSYSEEAKKACEEKKQKYYGDLPRGSNLLQFLLQFIKDMKGESFSLLLSHDAQAFFMEHSITGLAEIPKLPEDVIQALKQQLIHAPGNRVFRLLYENQLEGVAFDFSLFEDIMSALVDILAKKMPGDVSFNVSKLDAVINKIKLVPVPQSIVEENMVGPDGNSVEKNSGERALVRVKIPMKRVEEEEEVFSQETGEVVKQRVEKFVEGDIDDKALSLQARNDQVGYSIFSMSQAAPRIYRKDVFHYLKKNLGEYFDPKEPQKDIEPLLQKAEQAAEALDSAFLKHFCNDDSLPLIEFETNFNESE